MVDDRSKDIRFHLRGHAQHIGLVQGNGKRLMNRGPYVEVGAVPLPTDPRAGPCVPNMRKRVGT